VKSYATELRPLCFRPLKDAAEAAAYEELLRRTYERDGIFQEKFMPTGDVRRFGIFGESDNLIAICGLKPVDLAREAMFARLIELVPDRRHRMEEVVNVVVTKPYYGTQAFPMLVNQLCEAAVAAGADLIVGITRAALLKSFVQFGVYPAVHEPLDLLGKAAVQCFTIYYDFREPGALEYMRTRSHNQIEQAGRMEVLRQRYLQRTPRGETMVAA
jgi:hypothetical protein